MNQEEKICFIVGAGNFDKRHFNPRKQDYIIAADAGYFRLRELSLIPDMLIGDFDSLEEQGADKSILLDRIKQEETVCLIQLPREKDDTDMLAAMKEGRKRGYTRFALFGASGGRIDHTIANVQSMRMLARSGCRAALYDTEYELTVLENGEVTFPPYEKGFVGVFALSDKAEGVCIRGLKYALEYADVTNDFPIGASNEFMGKESRISVEKGCICIIRYFAE